MCGFSSLAVRVGVRIWLGFIFHSASIFLSFSAHKGTANVHKCSDFDISCYLSMNMRLSCSLFENRIMSSPSNMKICFLIDAINGNTIYVIVEKPPTHEHLHMLVCKTRQPTQTNMNFMLRFMVLPPLAATHAHHDFRSMETCQKWIAEDSA